MSMSQLAIQRSAWSMCVGLVLSAMAGNATAADYGPMTETVATAGMLLAVGSALRLCWKGRFSWEPAEEDVPRSAQRVGGLLIALFIGILWYRFKKGGMPADDLVTFGVSLGVVTLIAMLCYSFLVGTHVYEIKIGAGGRSTRPLKIIGGFWLTAAAKAALAPGDPPLLAPNGPRGPKAMTINDLLKGGGQQDLERVWSRQSRSVAKMAFQLAYIALVGFGTCALYAVALLLALNS
jgi:hypothetical protein